MGYIKGNINKATERLMLLKLLEKDLFKKEIADRFSKKIGKQYGNFSSFLSKKHPDLYKIFKMKKQAPGGKKGVSSWNKGLTKESSDIVRKLAEKKEGPKNPMYGKKAWNNGISKDSEYVKRLSVRMTERAISQETHKRMSEAAKKRTIQGGGMWVRSQEYRDKNRQRMLRMYKEGVFAERVNTKPVIIFREILNRNKVNYIQEEIICNFPIDFFLPDYEIAIEIQGDYWHANPKFWFNRELYPAQKNNIKRDTRKKKILNALGFSVLEFWEDDIYNRMSWVEEEFKKCLDPKRLLILEK